MPLRRLAVNAARLASVAACLTALTAPLQPTPAPPERSQLARAAAYHAAGVGLYDQGDLSAALRCYQRAWRWDPRQPERLAEIVSLAFSLERPEEAMRYALLGAERGAVDPALLRRMALLAKETEDYGRAARLYRRWLAQQPTGEAKGLNALMVRLEAAQLEYIDGDVQAAAQLYAETLPAISQGAGEAADRFRAALGGSFGSVLEVMSLCFLEAGRKADAEKAVALLAAEPDAVTEAPYWQARVALARGDAVTAVDKLMQYFDRHRDPVGATPYELLVEALTRLGDSARTVPLLEQIVATRPNQPDAVFALAQAKHRAGDREGATGLYERVVAWGDAEEDPSTGSQGVAVSGEAYLTSAARLLEEQRRQGQPGGALDLYRRVDAAWVLSVPTIEETFDDADFTQAVFDRLAASRKVGGGAFDPRFAARLAIAARRYRTAGAYYRDAINAASEQEQREELTAEWIDQLLSQGEFAESAEAIAWTLQHRGWEKDDPAPHYHLAGSLAMSDETDAAIDAAREAVRLDPDSAEFAGRLAWVSYQAKRYDDAAAAYEALIQRFDEDQDPATRAVLMDARAALSNICQTQGKHEAAEEWLEQALDEFPDDYAVKNDLGYLWADRGVNLKLARRLAAEAVTEKPDNGAYWDSLGWADYRLGDFGAAAESLEKAVALAELAGMSPGDGVMFDHLGDAYAAAGRTKEARRAWSRAAAMLKEADPPTAKKAAAKAKAD
ncbi:tetratricopeptide repeat protein [Pirellulimonas nuda]|uniref:Tetratricopeptide repeat protein n=1 Tax=Pirellulimonas nuda TaxID=2528009 RepID=A0A518D7T2_9BACT|nr:tetratricopeptide repeat protein [Pirellulimonas nuda]QDU87532.1 tetratricopeptide repeat protein [Pirellulimonas nuda]